MDSLKILILCQLFYPELVSTGQTLTELAETLRDMEVDVEVCCGPPTILKGSEKPPKDLTYHNIRIHRVWGTFFPKVSTMGKLVNQITYAISTFFYLLFRRVERPVLVVTNPPFLGFICAVLRKIKHLRFIYLIFDVYPDTAINLGVLKEGGLISNVWERSNRFVLKNSDAFIVIGRCMADRIRKKLCDLDVEEMRMKQHIIHVWADDRNIQPLPEGTENIYRKRWNLEGKFVLGYSGNMGRFHDMETIAEAARELREYEDIRFVFVGEGYKKKWLQTYVETNRLTNCVIDTYVPRKDLSLLLNAFDIGFVSLLPGQEGLSVPSKTFGLLAAGVPVIAIMNPNAEIAMVVKEESCGFVTPPGDSKALKSIILYCYTNRATLKTMKANARKAVDEKYSLNKVAQAYVSLISEISNLK